MKPISAFGLAVLFIGLGFIIGVQIPHARHNLATDVVLTVEPDAQCTSMYNGEGPALTYSTRCKLPNKAVLMCSVDTSSAAGKEKGLACVTVLAPPQPPAPPQAAAAPPAPVAPPVAPVAPAAPAPEGK